MAFIRASIRSNARPVASSLFCCPDAFELTSGTDRLSFTYKLRCNNRFGSFWRCWTLLPGGVLVASLLALLRAARPLRLIEVRATSPTLSSKTTKMPAQVAAAHRRKASSCLNAKRNHRRCPWWQWLHRALPATAVGATTNRRQKVARETVIPSCMDLP